MHGSKRIFAAIILSGLLLIRAAGAGDAELEPPKPSFDRINYATPQAYLFLNDHIGTREQVMKVAALIKGDTPEEKLEAISEWIENHLKYNAKAFAEWRNFDQMVADGDQGGCANYSVVFGALTRACGIPTVWVKTLEIEWITKFRKTGATGNWNGHVFLEVYINGRWMLLNDTDMLLYEDYNPKTRIFPGGFYAYDKGGDPYELVLSARWELWKQQTRAYFSKFDLSQLSPIVSGGRNLQHRDIWYFCPKRPVAAQVFEIDFSKLGYFNITARFYGKQEYEELQPYLPTLHTVVLILTNKDDIPEEFWNLLGEKRKIIQERLRKGEIIAEEVCKFSGVKLVMVAAPNDEELWPAITKATQPGALLQRRR